MTYKKLQTLMSAIGMHASTEQAKQFADIYRSSVKAGMTDGQAYAMVKLAYNATNGYTWEISKSADILEYHVKQENARKYPNGRDAEDLLAQKENRPSRWGTPEFHIAAKAI